ncbi:hypothetical protein DRO97_02800 [Archaeoglobales archaeon]|nr:MAG: hypothetical protein DRO97_02800 [Archaeoglobales archaeon]
MPKRYRTIVLRCEPDAETREALDTAFVEVSKFCEILEGEFSKLIYHKYREGATDTDAELHVRVSNLLARRFVGTVMGQKILTFDKDCYKLVKRNGSWFLEVRVLRKYEGKKLKAGTKYLIPIYKTDNKYYGLLLENSAFPVTLFKEGDQYKAAVSIPVSIKFEDSRPLVTIGINLTMWKHAASLYNPETNKFERNIFYDNRWVDEKAKKIQKKINFHKKQIRLKEVDEEDGKERIRKLHATISELIKKAHGEFISKLLGIADEYWDNGYNVVFSVRNLKGFGEITFRYPWLNYKLRSLLAWQKFANMLEPRGYYVVYPFSSIKECHRCGEKGEVVKRVFNCPNCNLKDFNAELNTARVVAKRGLDRAKKRRFYS